MSKRVANDNEDCKGTSALTLGDLQGDQSKIQLKKESIFYTKRNSRSMEFRVAVFNYDVVHI
jgi:hypothetical protein